MTTLFSSPLASEFEAFLSFKRSIGYKYVRAESTLHSFDRFLSSYISRNRTWRLDRVVLAWLASSPNRKAVSTSMEAAVLRQFYKFLQRRENGINYHEPNWPHLPTTSSFYPYIFSTNEIKHLLRLAGELSRPDFRSHLYQALILVLYCTGVRFGEALHLQIQDVDIQQGLMFITEHKGRSRWTPFNRSLGNELERYLNERAIFADARPSDRFFVGANRMMLHNTTASDTLRGLFRKAGLKPARGRIGPRPYDFRHTFAVHRLTRWYRQGVDLYARLPWLSAYMGHDDILGTETYLNATPELLGLAGSRFRRRYLSKD